MIRRVLDWFRVLFRRPHVIGTFVYCGYCRRVVASGLSTWNPTINAFVCGHCQTRGRVAP